MTVPEPGSHELERPLRSEAQAQADLAARDIADPHWRFRWFRRKRSSPTLFQRCLAFHIGEAGSKSGK
jgi:hypothetical protein